MEPIVPVINGNEPVSQEVPALTPGPKSSLLPTLLSILIILVITLPIILFVEKSNDLENPPPKELASRISTSTPIYPKINQSLPPTSSSTNSSPKTPSPTTSQTAIPAAGSNLAATPTMNGKPAILCKDSPGLYEISKETFESGASWSKTADNVKLEIGVDPRDPINKTMSLYLDGAEADLFKDINWPTNALEISFEYMFQSSQPGSPNLNGVNIDGDLTVYLGDPAQEKPIVFYDFSGGLANDKIISSDPIYVGQVAGKKARISFVGRTKDNKPYGRIVIDNLKICGLDDESFEYYKTHRQG